MTDIMSDPAYDTDLVTPRDRFQCFVQGHDATYGSLYGWCKRCKHTVWTYDRKSVLYQGEYCKYPPKHEPMADKRAEIERAVERDMERYRTRSGWR